MGPLQEDGTSKELKLSVINNAHQTDIPQKRTKHDILDIIGGDGPWQRRIFYALILIASLNAGHNMAITFMAPNIDYWCARPTDVANLSVEEWKSFGLPSNDTECFRYEAVNLTTLGSNLNSTVVPCDRWEYDNSFYVSTILAEWNLVCERKWLVSLSKSVYMIGELVSGLIFGYLSDKLGRRPTITVCCYLMIISIIANAFSTSYLMFAITRFFVAVGVGGYFNNFFVLLMEVLKPDKRAVYGNLIFIGWSIGFVVLPGVAWLIRDWFWIQIAFTVPCLIYLGAWWLIPESPRWLLSQGRLEEAKKTLIRAAEVNGRKMPDIEVQLAKVIAEASEDFDTGETEGSFVDLMRIPDLRKMTLILFYAWLVNAFIYYGVSFNTNDLAGDPFLNFALIGAVEFPAHISSIFIIQHLGRKGPSAYTLIAGGMACLVSYFVSRETAFYLVLVIVGKLCVTSSFGIVYLYTSELLPTVVRNAGLGWAGIFEQVGSIIAPFVRELGEYAGAFVPFMLFGFMGLSSGILLLFLPETKDSSIPDTLGEAASASRNDKTGPKKPCKNEEMDISNNKF